MAKIGRPAKYGSGSELEQGVNAYFAAISYQKPVVITTTTGEVDEQGNAVVVTQMLREGADHTGPPVTVTEYLEPPCIASLCLYLGISRDTWSEYAKKSRAMAEVVERTKTRIEAYLVGQLEGRHVQGVIFNLKNNFGWKERQEVSMDEPTRRAMAAGNAGAGMTTAEKRKVLEEIAAEFSGGSAPGEAAREAGEAPGE